MTTWHKGPPPSIGWWPASTSRNPGMLRWWNGENWSFFSSTKFDSVDRAARKAAYPLFIKVDEIEWTERPASWPERSKT